MDSFSMKSVAAAVKFFYQEAELVETDSVHILPKILFGYNLLLLD